MDEAVTITLDEYRELIIKSNKLNLIQQAFVKYDKYDRHSIMKMILQCDGYEEIKGE